MMIHILNLVYFLMLLIQCTKCDPYVNGSNETRNIRERRQAEAASEDDTGDSSNIIFANVSEVARIASGRFENIAEARIADSETRNSQKPKRRWWFWDAPSWPSTPPAPNTMPESTTPPYSNIFISMEESQIRDENSKSSELSLRIRPHAYGKRQKPKRRWWFWDESIPYIPPPYTLPPRSTTRLYSNIIPSMEESQIRNDTRNTTPKNAGGWWFFQDPVYHPSRPNRTPVSTTRLYSKIFLSMEESQLKEENSSEINMRFRPHAYGKHKSKSSELSLRIRPHAYGKRRTPKRRWWFMDWFKPATTTEPYSNVFGFGNVKKYNLRNGNNEDFALRTSSSYQQRLHDKMDALKVGPFTVAAMELCGVIINKSLRDIEIFKRHASDYLQEKMEKFKSFGKPIYYKLIEALHKIRSVNGHVFQYELLAIKKQLRNRRKSMSKKLNDIIDTADRFYLGDYNKIFGPSLEVINLFSALEKLHMYPKTSSRYETEREETQFRKSNKDKPPTREKVLMKMVLDAFFDPLLEDKNFYPESEISAGRNKIYFDELKLMLTKFILKMDKE